MNFSRDSSDHCKITRWHGTSHWKHSVGDLMLYDFICLILIRLGIYAVCVCVSVCLRVYLCSPFPCGKNSISVCVWWNCIFCSSCSFTRVSSLLFIGGGLLCDLPHRFIFSPYLFTWRFYPRVFAAASFLMPFISRNKKVCSF